jgi:glycosyltransferase involved in cell wall biosynthesis
MNLSVCILAAQYFGDNKIGGFASMSRQLAEGLAGRGIDVSVIAPNFGKLEDFQILNGVKVHTFRQFDFARAGRLIIEIDADIYHSQNPCILSRMAYNSMPESKHIATCRDPRDYREFFNEFVNATIKRKLKIPINYLMEYSLVKEMVRNADQVYVPANFLKEKTRSMFNPKTEIKMMPNIVHCNGYHERDSKNLEVVFIGRLDKRKRPEIVLDLAPKFPGITFNVVGKAEEAKRDNCLREKYAHLPNVRWYGFVDKFEEKEKFDSILLRSTAIVNSSSREGLPLTFIEAAARGCAIVSTVNPDDFAGKFGMFTTAENFAMALEDLQANRDKYIKLGKKAYDYVKKIYSHDLALQAHIDEYYRIMGWSAKYKLELVTEVIQ